MMRTMTVCVCAMMAILLLSSDASACGRRRARTTCYVATYSSCGTVYGGYAATTGYAPAPTYATPTSGYGYAQAPTYATPGYGYDYGRTGYNPGGLGGPRSGLGVRPGPGFGGLGPRR